jgi:hypothetical protein
MSNARPAPPVKLKLAGTVPVSAFPEMFTLVWMAGLKTKLLLKKLVNSVGIVPVRRLELRSTM